jgi:PIN domain nuclease of toxin-antitoxin system
MTGDILLDTCTAIWIAEDSGIAEEAEASLNESLDAGRPVMLSPVTAWEMGMLVARGRCSISVTVQSWFDGLIERPGTGLAELSPAILIQSSFLPGRPPRDPFDRIFIATARELGYRIMTRDRAILDYAEQGHVRALPC